MRLDRRFVLRRHDLSQRRMLRHERHVRCEYRDLHVDRRQVQQRHVRAPVRRCGHDVLHDGNRLPERRMLRHRQQVLRGGEFVLRRGRNGVRAELQHRDRSRLLPELRWA